MGASQDTCRFRNVPTPLLAYRIHPMQATVIDQAEMFAPLRGCANDCSHRGALQSLRKSADSIMNSVPTSLPFHPKGSRRRKDGCCNWLNGTSVNPWWRRKSGARPWQ